MEYYCIVGNTLYRYGISQKLKNAYISDVLSTMKGSCQGDFHLFPVLSSPVANMKSSVDLTWEFWQQLLFSDWLPSCESIVEPMSGIRSLKRKWPYKKVRYWPRHVSVVSSLKGEGFFPPPTAHYVAGRCSFEGRTNNSIVLNCCRLADDHIALDQLSVGEY